MKARNTWLILALFAVLAMWPGCQQSDECSSSGVVKNAPGSTGSTASKEEYLKKTEGRLSQIEKKEAGFQDTAAKWHGKTRKEFEEKLGALVEKRVYAKEKVNQLRSESDKTLANAKAELQPVMQDVEKRFERLDEYCR